MAYEIIKQPDLAALKGFSQYVEGKKFAFVYQK